jgi:serine phosphatase RsbU (regulator of sigma subunit)/tetratricopeptide (TPR) repeat protein
MRRFTFFLFLNLLSLGGIAQPTNIEATYTRLRSPLNDTAKVNALNRIAKYHVNKDQDSAWFYVQKAYDLSTSLDYPNGIAFAKLTMGVLESDRGNFPEALALILEASSLADSIGDNQTYAGCKLNLGNFYIKTGDHYKALEVYSEGIAFCEKHALYYTQASLYTSYGMGLKLTGQPDSALYYYDKVLQMHYDQLHDSVVIAAIYNNMASIHFAKGDHMTASNYLQKSLEINEKMGNQRYMLMNLSNLGELHGMQGGDFEKSQMYFNRALTMAKEMGAKEALETIYYGLSGTNYAHKRYKEAYEYLELSVAYKDSTMGDDKQAQIKEISEEFKTRQFKDSLQINQQQLEISNMNTEAANLRASKSTWQLLGSLFLLSAILVVLFFVYRNSKNQQRINQLLQEKNNEINHQKMEIEEKNTELTDSINYAKRIQQALLPSAGYLNKTLGDHFLFFKPKDIVSGDFYWVKKIENKHFFAVADCTGHGVPGAMMSMLGYETIEKVSSESFSNAAQFLNRVNEELTAALSSKTDEAESRQVKDGMDLSMCIVTEKQKLSYCGANNECYIIRGNHQVMPEPNDMISLHKGELFSVIELKATKRPVGYHYAEQLFKNVELQLLKGDMFYLFSDGYADQFGGAKGKKMKTSVFRELLLQNAAKSMTDQRTALKDHLNNWKNNFDQLDDITVLGVKVE